MRSFFLHTVHLHGGKKKRGSFNREVRCLTKPQEKHFFGSTPACPLLCSSSPYPISGYSSVRVTGHFPSISIIQQDGRTNKNEGHCRNQEPTKISNAYKCITVSNDIRKGRNARTHREEHTDPRYTDAENPRAEGQRSL